LHTRILFNFEIISFASRSFCKLAHSYMSHGQNHPLSRLYVARPLSLPGKLKDHLSAKRERKLTLSYQVMQNKRAHVTCRFSLNYLADLFPDTR